MILAPLGMAPTWNPICDWRSQGKLVLHLYDPPVWISQCADAAMKLRKTCTYQVASITLITKCQKSSITLQHHLHMKKYYFLRHNCVMLSSYHSIWIHVTQYTEPPVAILLWPIAIGPWQTICCSYQCFGTSTLRKLNTKSEIWKLRC